MSDIISDYNPFRSVICNNCKHRIKAGKCKAFDNIPDEIIFGDNDHKKVLPGQKGNYVFTPKSK